MEKQSFSIKKYSFGVSSTLVGLLLVGANVQAEEVKPETVAKATSSQASSTAPVTTKAEKVTSTAPVTTKAAVTTSTAAVTTSTTPATSKAPKTTVTTKAPVATTTTVATTEAPKTTVTTKVAPITTKEQVKSTTSSAVKTETPKVEVKKEQTPKTEVKKGVVKADYVAGEYRSSIVSGPAFVLNSDMTVGTGKDKVQLEKTTMAGYVVLYMKNATTVEMSTPLFVVPAGKDLFPAYDVLLNPEDNDLTKDRILVLGYNGVGHILQLTKTTQKEIPVTNKNMTADKKASVDKNLAKAVVTNASSKTKVAEEQKSTKTTNTNKKVVDNKNTAKAKEKVESAKKVLPKTQAEKSNTALPAELALVLAAAGLMTIKARKN